MMLKGDKLLKYILIHGLEQNPASWEKTIKDIAQDVVDNTKYYFPYYAKFYVSTDGIWKKRFY